MFVMILLVVVRGGVRRAVRGTKNQIGWNGGTEIVGKSLKTMDGMMLRK